MSKSSVSVNNIVITEGIKISQIYTLSLVNTKLYMVYKECLGDYDTQPSPRCQSSVATIRGFSVPYALTCSDDTPLCDFSHTWRKAFWDSNSGLQNQASAYSTTPPRRPTLLYGNKCVIIVTPLVSYRTVINVGTLHSSNLTSSEHIVFDQYIVPTELSEYISDSFINLMYFTKITLRTSAIQYQLYQFLVSLHFIFTIRLTKHA